MYLSKDCKENLSIWMIALGSWSVVFLVKGWRRWLKVLRKNIMAIRCNFERSTREVWSKARGSVSIPMGTQLSNKVVWESLFLTLMEFFSHGNLIFQENPLPTCQSYSKGLLPRKVSHIPIYQKPRRVWIMPYNNNHCPHCFK